MPTKANIAHLQSSSSACRLLPDRMNRKSFSPSVNLWTTSQNGRHLLHFVGHHVGDLKPRSNRLDALEYTQKHVLNGDNFNDVWKKLLPADQEVLKLLAQGVTDLHSEPVRMRLGSALGLDKPVNKNTPQHSLRRLQDNNLVAKLDYGNYQL